MFEVIIERPRVKPSRGGRKGRHRESTERAFERAPKVLGMGRAGRTKSLNENLAPLRRFLRSRVGTPWDAVRSEMGAVLALSSAVQKHVLDHARQYVEENPRMIDGRPHRPAASRGVYWPLGQWCREFYVCPETGLLCEAPVAHRRAPRS
jgi:hypothetical protein